MSYKRDLIGETTHLIEKILSLKIENGVEFALVKWCNYPNSENSWEPTSNLFDCQQLIKHCIKEKTIVKKMNQKYCKSIETPPFGLDRQLKPEKILDGFILRGVEILTMKWIGSEETDFVLKSKIRNKYPLLLLKFYLEEAIKGLLFT